MATFSTEWRWRIWLLSCATIALMSFPSISWLRYMVSKKENDAMRSAVHTIRGLRSRMSSPPRARRHILRSCTAIAANDRTTPPAYTISSISRTPTAVVARPSTTRVDTISPATIFPLKGSVTALHTGMRSNGMTAAATTDTGRYARQNANDTLRSNSTP